MKTILVISILLFSLQILADSPFIEDLDKIRLKIVEQEVDAHVKSKGATPLSGEYIAALLPTLEVDESQTCVEEKEKKGTHYEVILVAQGNSQTTSSQFVSAKPSEGHKIFAEELVAFAADSNLSESNLAKAMASMIKSKYPSDEEGFNALSAFSSRLNEVYNKARNPGYNTEKNNPDGVALPSGNITLNEITKAAFLGNKYDAGVCNDIAQAVALVGEQLFPDKDVLTVNSGSHHAVVVSDGKKNRIIDYGRQTSMENQLVLDPKFSATNMRVSKMDNGHLKQIAVVDTQSGQMMEQAFQTGKPLLKTNTDISSFVSHFKVVKTGNNKKSHEVTVATGTGDLDHSKMYVVVAKYEYNSERWRNYVGVGGSAMNFDTGKTGYQLHLRGGTEFGIIRYATPKLSVKLTSGLQIEGMYGFQPPPEKDENGEDIKQTVQDVSGNLDVVTRANMSYKVNQKLKLIADLESRHTIGPKSWGTSTGAWAGGIGAGLGGTLKNLRLHLNQTNAELGAEHKVSDKTTAYTRVKYQGSNVGQSLGVLAGLNITAPKGAQILVFTGLSTTKLAGYETQHSLLVGANGAIIGAGIQTKSGITFTGSISNISTDAPPIVQGGLSIPLGGRPKKHVRSHHFE